MIIPEKCRQFFT